MSAQSSHATVRRSRILSTALPVQADGFLDHTEIRTQLEDEALALLEASREHAAQRRRAVQVYNDRADEFTNGLRDLLQVQDEQRCTQCEDLIVLLLKKFSRAPSLPAGDRVEPLITIHAADATARVALTVDELHVVARVLGIDARDQRSAS